jgi:hypothetical protein
MESLGALADRLRTADIHAVARRRPLTRMNCAAG